jgi:hypothetical protein
MCWVTGSLGCFDRFAVRLDHAAVNEVERAQVGDGVVAADVVVVQLRWATGAPGVPTGDPPSVAMRSATSSTIDRTASICGSSMVCTAMTCGPTPFQWMCLSVSARSLSALSRSCRRVMTSSA